MQFLFWLLYVLSNLCLFNYYIVTMATLILDYEQIEYSIVTQCANHVDTTWIPRGYHVVRGTTWIPHGSHVVTTWYMARGIYLKIHVVSTWWLCGIFHVDLTMWDHVVTTWGARWNFPCGF